MTLPSHTIALDVSNNRIAGKPNILSSPPYKQIRKLNISHNKISSFEGLRYTSFLSKFSGKKYTTIQYSSENEPVLDLTHNNISTIATWLYSSQLHSKLYLIGNPWSCPCLQVLHFTSFHQKNTHLLPDGDFLACADIPGSLSDLTMREECHEEQMDPYIVIIAVELLLLLALGFQFYSDWKLYTTTRQLPWISEHLPGWLKKGILNIP